MPHSTKPGSTAVSLKRLEALTDGIFAIAMTILVLNLKVPKGGGGASSSLLAGQLQAMWPALFNYGLSFYILAMMWIANNRQLRIVKRTGRLHLLSNLSGLMFVCLVPFSTTLLSDYPGSTAAEMFFHLNLLAVGLTFLGQWRYVAKDYRLISSEADARSLNRGGKLALVLPTVALAAAVASIWLPGRSTMLYIAIPVVTSWINRLSGRAK